jgi:hypothetical protein
VRWDWDNVSLSEPTGEETDQAGRAYLRTGPKQRGEDHAQAILVSTLLCLK